MRDSMTGYFIDKRIWFAAALTVVASILSLIADLPEGSEKLGVQSSSPAVKFDRTVVSGMIDSIASQCGVQQRKRILVSAGAERTELRGKISSSFGTLQFIGLLQDSLSVFNIRSIATENIKESIVTIHLMHGRWIFESIVLSQLQKGAIPSQRKIQKVKQAVREPR